MKSSSPNFNLRVETEKGRRATASPFFVSFQPLERLQSSWGARWGHPAFSSRFAPRLACAGKDARARNDRGRAGRFGPPYDAASNRTSLAAPIFSTKARSFLRDGQFEPTLNLCVFASLWCDLSVISRPLRFSPRSHEGTKGIVEGSSQVSTFVSWCLCGATFPSSLGRSDFHHEVTKVLLRDRDKVARRVSEEETALRFRAPWNRRLTSFRRQTTFPTGC